MQVWRWVCASEMIAHVLESGRSIILRVCTYHRAFSKSDGNVPRSRGPRSSKKVGMVRRPTNRMGLLVSISGLLGHRPMGSGWVMGNIPTTGGGDAAHFHFW